MDTLIDECNSSSGRSESEDILNEIDLQKYCENTIFIDMRGFQSNFGRFICKEFCLIDTDGDIYHKFIKSSFPVNKLKYEHQLKVDLEQKWGHRIPYDYGNTGVVELIIDIYRKIDTNKKIFVRDPRILHRLKYLLRNFCQIDDHYNTLCQLNFDKTTLSKKLSILPYCDFHNSAFGLSNGPCAKNTAHKLRHAFAEVQKNHQQQRNDN